MIFKAVDPILTYRWDCYEFVIDKIPENIQSSTHFEMMRKVPNLFQSENYGELLILLNKIISDIREEIMINKYLYSKHPESETLKKESINFRDAMIYWLQFYIYVENKR